MFNLRHYDRANWPASIALMIGLVIGSLLAPIRQASAHEGPPYPILVDKMLGPWLVSVWADPDVGVGSFFIILEPPRDGTLPEDITIEIGVQPLSGRLAEARYKAEREDLRNRTRFKAEIPFDAQERWLTRILLKSSRGGGEATVEVEVTPPGYGRWDLLLYLFPFLAVGFLWLKAFLRRRSRRSSDPSAS
ncbi:MAG TPA: hypothetical protein VJ810_23460 [Blastocatellia bacterium]|nr:hypothetical protein [Blastocatellia bacterium]